MRGCENPGCRRRAVEGELCARHAIWAAYDDEDHDLALAVARDHGVGEVELLRIKRDAADYRARAEVRNRLEALRSVTEFRGST